MQYRPGLRRAAKVALVTAVMVSSLPLTAGAATLSVDLNNPAPASPYTNWVTAATNIQDAVDAAADGDEVLKGLPPLTLSHETNTH